MREKEDEFTGDTANIWLTTEATSRDHINRVGTFRYSIDHCISLDTTRIRNIFLHPLLI